MDIMDYQYTISYYYYNYKQYGHDNDIAHYTSLQKAWILLAFYTQHTTYNISLLISLMFRTKQVIKVMRAKDKGDKKTDSDKCFYWYWYWIR